MVIQIATRDIIEEVLAEIKHSVKTGALDRFLSQDLSYSGPQSQGDAE